MKIFHNPSKRFAMFLAAVIIAGMFSHISYADADEYEAKITLVSTGKEISYSDVEAALAGHTGSFSLEIDGSIIRLAKNAFAQNLLLTSVKFSGVQSIVINNSAFENCKSLSEVIFEPGEDSDLKSSIESKAFENCSSLESINLSALQFDFIGRRAFYNCENLSKVSLSAHLEEIGISAFANCSKLEIIEFYGDKPNKIDDTTFSDSGTDVGGIIIKIFENASGFEQDKWLGFTISKTLGEVEPDAPSENDGNNNSGDDDDSDNNTQDGGGDPDDDASDDDTDDNTPDDDGDLDDNLPDDDDSGSTLPDGNTPSLSDPTAQTRTRSKNSQASSPTTDIPLPYSSAAISSGTEANGSYKIILPSSGDVMQVEIPCTSTVGSSIEVETEIGSYLLPSNLPEMIPDFWDTIKNYNLDIDDINFKLSFSDKSLDALVQEAFKNSMPSGILLAPIVDFTLEVIDINTGNVITNVERFLVNVVRSLNVSGEVDPDLYICALRLNEETAEFEFVPHWIEEYDDGIRIVILYKGNSIYAVAQNRMTFDDLSEDHWGRDFINEACAKLLLKPVGGNLCGPNQTLSRSEFRDMLRVALGAGWPDELNGSAEPITREEMVYALAESLNIYPTDDIDISLFTDYKDINEQYAASVKTLASLQIVQGMGDGKFAPTSTATRAQAATVIIKALRVLGLIR